MPLGIHANSEADGLVVALEFEFPNTVFSNQ